MQVLRVTCAGDSWPQLAAVCEKVVIGVDEKQGCTAGRVASDGHCFLRWRYKDCQYPTGSSIKIVESCWVHHRLSLPRENYQGQRDAERGARPLAEPCRSIGPVGTPPQRQMPIGAVRSLRCCSVTDARMHPFTVEKSGLSSNCLGPVHGVRITRCSHRYRRGCRWLKR